MTRTIFPAVVLASLCTLSGNPCAAQEVATSDPALICGYVGGMSYSRQHRKLLLEDERRADFARHGVPWSQHSHYELDHVVPLCLGGADTPANRRPQGCDTWRGIACVAGPAADKDALEEKVCHDFCAAYRHGKPVDLVALQAYFAKWRY
jgi:hypothetical protein